MAQQLLTAALTVFEQMALDETLVRTYRAPVLRFYHWTPGPAVTFGYSQFYAAVKNQVTPAQGPACRRPTGGGVVFHGEDLTFSLVFQSELNRPRDIYAALHSAIERTLGEMGALSSSRQAAVVAAQYAPMQKGVANDCFANPVEDDLLSGGRKILGGAIRRFDKIILYQGSLQCSDARENPVFRRAVKAAAEQMLGVLFEPAAVDQPVMQQARQLAAEQYQTDAWTYKF